MSETGSGGEEMIKNFKVSKNSVYLTQYHQHISMQLYSPPFVQGNLLVEYNPETDSMI